jgi:glucose/arabinose dehydrogenase
MFVRSLGIGLAALALATCGGGGGGNGDGGGDDDGDGSVAPDATPAPYCQPASGTNLRLQLITDDLVRPVGIAAPAADSRIFIVEQVGRIRVVKDGLLLKEPFLTIDTNDGGNEQGLLGLAFHPDYDKNGRFFVFYVQSGSNDLRVAEYHADAGADVADPEEKVILDVAHPSADNHNGGTVAFGPDGLLYISFGDGGAADNYYEHGQETGSRLAKILRVDVDGGDPYAIPPSNPWAGGGGVAEMFAWGLRNPWRIAIDSSNGDVWIGDVGQGLYEEIDVVRGGTSGQNFGWAVFEGPSCFTADPDGDLGCDNPGDYVAPVTAYNRDGTGQCSVVAGGVYRGTCMPDMVGRFFFGDYCSGEVRSFPASSDTIEYSATTDHTSDVDPQGVLYGRLSSFGTDGYGELYVAAMQGGAVYRIEVE